jgi:hypothetical protein
MYEIPDITCINIYTILLNNLSSVYEIVYQNSDLTAIRTFGTLFAFVLYLNLCIDDISMEYLFDRDISQS